MLYIILRLYYILCVSPSCRSQNNLFLPKWWYCFKVHCHQNIPHSSFFSNINFNYFDNVKYNINDISFSITPDFIKFSLVWTVHFGVLNCDLVWVNYWLKSLQLPDPDTAYQNYHHVTSSFLKNEKKIFWKKIKPVVPFNLYAMDISFGRKTILGSE